MKCIFKKTLACVLAAGVLTSSVTAFAATNETVKPEVVIVAKDPQTGLNFRIKGESTAEVTKYSSHFEFTTTVESPKGGKISTIGVVYELLNADTGKQYGTKQTVYEYDSDSAWAIHSVPLSVLSPVAARCWHHAYLSNGSLMGEYNGKTFVIAD